MIIKFLPYANLTGVLTSGNHYNTDLFPASNINNPLVNRPWRAAGGGSCTITFPDISATNVITGILFYGLELNGMTLTVQDGTTATNIVSGDSGDTDAATVTKLWITPGLNGMPGNSQEPAYDLSVSGSEEWSIGAVYLVSSLTGDTTGVADITQVTQFKQTLNLEGTFSTDLNGASIRDFIQAKHSFQLGWLDSRNTFDMLMTGPMFSRRAFLDDRSSTDLTEVTQNYCLMNVFDDSESDASYFDENIWPVRLAPNARHNSKEIGFDSSGNSYTDNTLNELEEVK